MMNAYLNANHNVMKISKLISDLSEMKEDDYQKVKMYEKIISELEFEYIRIAGLSNQFPCSVYFLKEAIDKYKELRRACEFHALTELCRRTSEEKELKKKGKRPLENDVSAESSAGGSASGKRGEWWLRLINSPMNNNK